MTGRRIMVANRLGDRLVCSRSFNRGGTCPLHRPDLERMGDRRDQGGFALLLIFLMAAMVAIMLYRELPRVAFESSRDQEQLLIDRGEEYVRAIELYYRDNQRWPQSIDDLEDTNDKRYLRKRYLDPYTGEEEWRLIHTNGTYLTDSLVEKPPDVDPDAPNQNQNFGNPNDPAESAVNVAVLERPSDRTLPDASSFNAPTPNISTGTLPGDQFNPFAQNGPQINPNDPVQQAALNGLPGQVPGQVPGQPGGFTPQFPGQQFPGQQFPGQQGPGQPPGAQTGFIPQFPGQQPPGGYTDPNGNVVPPGGVVALNGQNFRVGPNGQLLPVNAGGSTQVGQNTNGQNGAIGNFNQQLANFGQNAGQNGAVNNNQTNVAPAQFPGQVTSGRGSQLGFPAGAANAPGAPGANNAAVNIINQLLTTPRQPPAGIGGAQANNAIGGGIAGVASNHSGPTIKVYRDRSKYEEWEFVYVPAAGAAVGGNQGGLPLDGQDPNGQNPGSDTPNGFNPTGFNPTGLNPTGFNPTGLNPTGLNPGGTNPGGLNPGRGNNGGGRGNPGGFGPNGVGPGGIGGLPNGIPGQR